MTDFLTVQMAVDEAHESDVPRSLAALFTHLNVACNRDLLDAVSREQLSFSEWLLLDRLRGGHRRPTIRQAAALMHVTPAAASRIVDRLGRRGLVRRETDDRDCRTKRITITPRGDEAIVRLHQVRIDRMETFTDTLTDRERDALAGALSQLLEHEQIAACLPHD